jgi:hypothetical protein
MPVQKFIIFSITVMTGISVSISSSTASAQSQCPAGHCSMVNPQINDFCKSNGNAGKQFAVTSADGSWCWCGCSCVDQNTYTFTYNEMATSSLEDPADMPVLQLVAGIRRGQPLFTPTSRYVSVDNFIRSANSDGEELLVIQFKDERALTVSKNHTFITRDERVIKADELKPGTKVKADLAGRLVTVSKVTSTRENRQLYNVIVNASSVYPEDHLWYTNGIWSGDWTLQTANDILNTEIKLRSSTLTKAFKK